MVQGSRFRFHGIASQEIEQKSIKNSRDLRNKQPGASDISDITVEFLFTKKA